jgi:hypothetical protein
VKPDAYNGPVADEGQFRDFARRLIRVPKREIDVREKARRAMAARRGTGVKVPVDKPKTEG